MSLPTFESQAINAKPDSGAALSSSALIADLKRRSDEAWRLYQTAYHQDIPVPEIEDAYRIWKDLARQYEAARSLQ